MTQMLRNSHQAQVHGFPYLGLFLVSRAGMTMCTTECFIAYLGVKWSEFLGCFVNEADVSKGFKTILPWFIHISTKTSLFMNSFQDFDSYLPWLSSSCTTVLLMSVPRSGTLCVLPCQNNKQAVMGWLLICKILLRWKNHLILQWLKLGKNHRGWYWPTFPLFFLFLL